jgi:hypothetical protein
MPFCRHCGVEHSDVDRFCPSCGRRVENDVDAPPEFSDEHHAPPTPPRAPGARLGAVATLEHALTGMGRNGLWGLVLIASLQALASLLAFALTGLLLLEATFSTYWPRRILRTSCFRRVNAFPLSGMTYSWDGRNYKLRAGCDPIRPHINTLGLSATAVLAVVVVGVVTAAGVVALLRRCDRQAGSGRRWPILPAPAQLARATYRQVGWSLAFYVAAVLTLGIAAIPIGTTAATAGGSGGGVLIAIELVAYAYLAIRWVVPWLVRVYLAWVRMLLDDRPLPAAYAEVPAPGVKRAWALVGLTVAVLVVIGLIATMVVGFVPSVQIPLQIVITVLEAMVYGTFAVAAMRNLTGELGRDATGRER